MAHFHQAFSSLHKAEFNDIALRLLNKLGYKIPKSKGAAHHTVIYRDNFKISLLVKQDTSDKFSKLTPTVTLTDCEILQHHMKQERASAGFIVTNGSICTVAHDFIRKNSLYGLSSYEFIRLLMHTRSFKLEQCFQTVT